MDAQRIAIIGTGAVGGVVAAAAHASGHDVVLCARTPFDTLTVESPEGVTEVPATVCTVPSEAPDADWVVLTTKIPDVPGTQPWLRRFDDGSTPLVVMQNGAEHEESVAGFGLRSPLLPSLVFVGAERKRPGHVVRRSDCTVSVPAGDLGARFAALFDDPATTVRQTRDFHTAVWRKMLWNLAANPITALTLRRLDVFGDPDIRQLADGVLAEAIEVARAEGAELGGADAEKVIASFTGTFEPGTGTSMLYDRLAGRPMEYEHITGAVVRAGARHGIPTPLNQALLALLRNLA